MIYLVNGIFINNNIKYTISAYFIYSITYNDFTKRNAIYTYENKTINNYTLRSSYMNSFYIGSVTTINILPYDYSIMYSVPSLMYTTMCICTEYVLKEFGFPKEKKIVFIKGMLSDISCSVFL